MNYQSFKEFIKKNHRRQINFKIKENEENRLNEVKEVKPHIAQPMNKKVLKNIQVELCIT